MQADDLQVPPAHDLFDLFDRFEQDAEFGQVAAGHGLDVVAVADIRIEAQAEPHAGMLLRDLFEA